MKRGFGIAREQLDLALASALADCIMARAGRPTPAGWRSLATGYAILDFPEHARRIGEIMALWTDVEQHMVLVLGWFIQRKVGTAELMIHLLNSSEARISIFEAVGIGFFFEPVDKGNFSNCITTIGVALKKRNELAHSIYTKDDKGHLRLNKPRRGITTQEGSRVITIKDLENTKGIMSLIHNQLHWIHNRAETILLQAP